MKSVELFAGAGGLALGVELAGFEHAAVVEFNRHACATMRQNFTSKNPGGYSWPVHETDIRAFDFRPLDGKVELVSGGPPCQPFSIGGKARGHQDRRDMFPEAARVVRETKPRAFIFENVRGLLRQSFARYFEYIKLQLTYPELTRRDSEDWPEHLQKLQEHHTRGTYKGLHYRVVASLVNAADYGVPQKRERVVIVGFRSDVQEGWSFPKPTHSREALASSQWVTGDYWERHQVARKNRPQPPATFSRPANFTEPALFELPASIEPWRTVRDAISDLPKPAEREHPTVKNHRLQKGARSYPGHTGSPLDEPAKTLKAGDHGVPGGENMLACPDGSVRYFTVRESARLQTFPDWFVFSSAWSESMRQIGNAVPVHLASRVAMSVREALDRKDRRVRS